MNNVNWLNKSLKVLAKTLFGLAGAGLLFSTTAHKAEAGACTGNFGHYCWTDEDDNNHCSTDPGEIIKQDLWDMCCTVYQIDCAGKRPDDSGCEPGTYPDRKCWEECGYTCWEECYSCFPAGTKVRMAGGKTKNIEDVEADERMKAPHPLIRFLSAGRFGCGPGLTPACPLETHQPALAGAQGAGWCLSRGWAGGRATK